MKRFVPLVVLFILAFSTMQAEEEESIDIDTVSKAIGHVIARQFDQPGFAFNFEKVIEGMHEARAGKEAPLSDKEVEETLAKIQERIFSEIATQNLEKATAFLEENKTKEGIISVEEKLQYQITQVGKGEEVVKEATPLIHYKGTLLDGTTFGNSYEMGDPIPLPLAQTIPGFSKGIAGMKEGEKRTLYIHPDLGYGANGHLPPNSLLIFEIEVVQADTQEEEPLAQEEE